MWARGIWVFFFILIPLGSTERRFVSLLLATLAPGSGRNHDYFFFSRQQIGLAT